MSERRVILLGRLQSNLERGRALIKTTGIEFILCTSLPELDEALKIDGVDTVISGAGLELSVRLDAVRMIFEASDEIAVHMKDFASGPEGFGVFANKVLAKL